jgi:glycosyltransferase involved in cell wall biosynthesis
VGSVPHSSVLDYYAAMDVLVYARYPSALTNMISPLKPLEPMAMARCVVGSDVGGIAELVNDKVTGLLFPAGSRAALVATLASVLSGASDATLLGNNARAHVVSNRQWRHMAACYEAAYERAFSGRAVVAVERT